jgi:hypothetical protein
MGLLEWIILILVILWLLGSVSIGGSLINILLVIALVIIVYRLTTGQRL